MNRMFSKGRQAFAAGNLDWDAQDFRVMLIRSTYTYDDADEFLADLGSVDNGRSAALANKTNVDGVLDADDTSLNATAAVACNALGIFQHTGSDATARLVAYIDNRFRFTVAAAASGGATSISVDALAKAIANGAVASLISGTGPATITLGAAASAGGRTLTVSALGSALSADAVYEVAISGATGLPFTPGVGQNVPIGWDSGADKIIKI